MSHVHCARPESEIHFFLMLFSKDCKVKALDVLINFSLEMEDSALEIFF